MRGHKHMIETLPSPSLPFHSLIRTSCEGMTTSRQPRRTSTCNPPFCHDSTSSSSSRQVLISYSSSAPFHSL